MDSKPIQQCRLCGCSSFREIINLGEQCYTGRFPSSEDTTIPRASLDLVQCLNCFLIQLKHSYPSDEMYGDEYGYRSSITDTMKTHLRQVKQTAINQLASTAGNPRILDIGSNDGTLLSYFEEHSSALVGVDPCAQKYIENYPESSTVISSFFTANEVVNNCRFEKFDIISSIAMFYDVDDPVGFALNIKNLLSDEGIWVTEQTNSHTLVEVDGYDSICHEHVTYLSLSSFEAICDRAGLKIINLSTNQINGGSFTLTIGKQDAPYAINGAAIQEFKKAEQDLHLENEETWTGFRTRVANHKDSLTTILNEYKSAGREVLGYGASTKGNVILQYCGITRNELPFILERDPNKFGKFTPGTRIPIISEEEGRNRQPDALLVFPWHFKDEIIEREKEYLENGGTLIFPLPTLELVNSNNTG